MATATKKTIPAERKPFYALAGAGDLAVAKLRDLPVELQKELAKVPVELSKLPAQVQQGAAQVQKTVQQRFAEVQKLPTQVQTRATFVQAIATGLYGELATRGEKAIGQLRREAKGRSKTAAKDTTKSAGERAQAS